MPVVHPAEIWRRSGRYDAVGPEMARFKDRKNSDLVLAMTHEEVVADLCRTEIRSPPAASAARLPHPDQVPGRPPPPGRTYPGPRVHDEGLLHPRPRRRGSGSAVPRPLRGVLPHLRPLRTAHHRRRLRRRDDGRQPGARVHVPHAGGRGHPGAVRRLRLCGQPPDRPLLEDAGGTRSAASPRTGRDAGSPDDPRAGGVPQGPGGADREGRVPHRRARRRRPRGNWWSPSSAATWTSTRRSSRTRSGLPGSVRRRTRRSGAPALPRDTPPRSGSARARWWWTMGSRHHRTWWRGRTSRTCTSGT